MSRRVELAFLDAAGKLIPDGATVVAAVSGGSDSVALLHLLTTMSRGRYGVAVAHLDHAVRRGSTADRRFVERLAAQLGCPCHAGRRAVAALRRKDESAEEAARRVRRAFLLEALVAQGADLVCTGHTLDDQAETVLMRLARGAGAGALAGMRATGPGPFARPLLALERAELREWLRRHDLPFREDPTNRDLRHDRNRVRHLVVPLLNESLNPRAARHLVEAADRLRDDAEYLDALAARRFDSVSDTRGSGVRLDVQRLRRTAAPIATRVARLALQRSGADPRRIGARHIEALLDFIAGTAPGPLHLPSGVAARRDGARWIALGRETAP